MGWRVSDEQEIRDLIEVKDTDSMRPFLDTANALTDKVAAEDSSDELTDAMLAEIEKYLAAHFAAHRHQQYASESTGGASATYQGQFGMGLSSTQWGQSAMIMDVTGYLRDLDEGVTTVDVTWLGLPPSSQTDYANRD